MKKVFILKHLLQKHQIITSLYEIGSLYAPSKFLLCFKQFTMVPAEEWLSSTIIEWFWVLFERMTKKKLSILQKIAG